MRALKKRAVFLKLLIVLLMGCATPADDRYPPTEAETAATIHVVGRGWHTGIVVRRADIPPGVWPESADFAEAEYLKVGWGDRDYYPAAEFSAWYGIKALFWPTPSVLHVLGFSGPPARRFPGDEVVALPLTRDGVERLARFIDASHERDGAARATPVAPSREGPGWFYPSNRTFHLFDTCNVWTAEALRAAGLPVRSFLALTTGSVMAQVRGFGRVIQPHAAAETCRAAAR